MGWGSVARDNVQVEEGGANTVASLVLERDLRMCACATEVK